MRAAAFLALAASLSGAIAQDSILGFNSGATDDTGKVKKEADFEKEFKAAQSLQKTPGTFNSIRLYTNIQGDTDTDPIEAFAAAVKTKTKLLLGLWCSGTDNIDKEVTALKNGIQKHGKAFTDLVVGISVGSEDLYRVSESGIRNKVGLGQPAETIVKFIKEVKDAVKGTDLEKTPVGHVDTWTSWVNETNKAVIDESDFVGVNAFPYYEDDKDNPITNAKNLFFDALNKTEDAAGDKPVWITETGWPYTGPDFGKAKATLENSKTFWDEVGCSLFGKKNVWWYVLRDSNPDNKAKFAVTENLQSQTRFDMTCPAAAGAPAPVNNNTNNNSQQGSGSGGNGEGAGNTMSVNSMMAALSVVLTFEGFFWIFFFRVGYPSLSMFN